MKIEHCKFNKMIFNLLSEEKRVLQTTLTANVGKSYKYNKSHEIYRYHIQQMNLWTWLEHQFFVDVTDAKFVFIFAFLFSIDILLYF